METYRMRHLFSSLILTCIFFPVSLRSQTANPSLVRELLDLPAPPAAVPLKETVIAKERTADFYDVKNIPPDDAPIEDLLDYWKTKNTAFDDFRYNLKPSKETIKRILDVVRDDPEKITNYLKLLPNDADVADFVTELYQNQSQASRNAPYWLTQVKKWLRNNTDMFVDELLQSAGKVKMENGYLTLQQDFEYLAIVAWDRAKPFVDRFEGNRTNIETYTLAKYVLYHNALKEKNSSDAERYREELKKLVEDKSLSYKARDLAMDALVLGGDFEGRTEWYMSLLKDETLLELQENGFTGLTTLPRYLPESREEWLPSMMKLIENGTPAQRSAALRNLMQIAGEKNVEIYKLLLPWLSDKNWARESRENERKKLIEALGKIDLPEAVPGLIAVVMNEDGDIRSEAAKSLVRYKPPEAIPALRSAMLDETEPGYRNSIIEALVAAGGLSDDEQMAALEAFAVMRNTQKNAEESDDDSEDYDEFVIDGDETPIPVEISIGAFLSEYDSPSDGLILRVIERVKILKRSNPPVAEILSEIMQKWGNRLVDLEMLDQVKTGTADVKIIIKLLTKREELRQRVPGELSAMRLMDGLPRGLSAAISEDTAAMIGVLGQADAETQAAVLAGARLLRIDLPVQTVGALLDSPNKLLALAAARYLESEDSPPARTLVLSKHADEVRLLGARQAFVPDDEKNFFQLREELSEMFESVNGSNYYVPDYEELIKTETKLRDEIKQNADLQAVFALFGNEDKGQKVVRVFKDRIVFTSYEDTARYRERNLSPQEYEAFYRFLLERNIDALKSAGNCYDCMSGEFVMFGRGGGRRIFIQSPSYIKLPPLDQLLNFFESFEKGDLKLHYRLSEKIEGLEVLLADDKLTARAVWKNGGDMRVLIADEEKRTAILEDLAQKEETEDAVPVVDESERDTRQRERRMQAAYGHFAWRKMDNGKLAPTETVQPPERDLSEQYSAEQNFLSTNFRTRTRYMVQTGGKFRDTHDFAVCGQSGKN